MNSILDIITKTTVYFNGRNIDKPRLQAESLIAHALGIKRMDLYLQAQRPLEEQELEKIRPLVRRRAKREPLQYVVGETDFWKNTLICRPGALIPRPETEELIEEVVTLWKQLSPNAPKRILDLGTGSGAIAIALATEFPEAEVHAIDASIEPLVLAQENATKNGLISRIQFTHSNWFESVSGTFDLIVSNPPYLTQNETDVAEPEVKDYEPVQALIGADADGAGDIRKILTDARNFASLNDPHLVAFETGIDQHANLTTYAQEEGWKHTLGKSDFDKRPRFFFASDSAPFA